MSVVEPGGIVVRVDRGAPRYLLVTAKRNQDHWLFPKGHVEPGESPSEAALREIREEAGVEGRVLAPLGPTEFVYAGQPVHVEYFLIRYGGGSGRPEQGRKSAWLSYEDALARLTFEETRQLLRASRGTVAARLKELAAGS